MASQIRRMDNNNKKCALLFFFFFFLSPLLIRAAGRDSLQQKGWNRYVLKLMFQLPIRLSRLHAWVVDRARISILFGSFWHQMSRWRLLSFQGIPDSPSSLVFVLCEIMLKTLLLCPWESHKRRALTIAHNKYLKKKSELGFIRKRDSNNVYSIVTRGPWWRSIMRASTCIVSNGTR